MAELVALFVTFLFLSNSKRKRLATFTAELHVSQFCIFFFFSRFRYPLFKQGKEEKCQKKVSAKTFDRKLNILMWATKIRQRRRRKEKEFANYFVKNVPLKIYYLPSLTRDSFRFRLSPSFSAVTFIRVYCVLCLMCAMCMRRPTCCRRT